MDLCMYVIISGRSLIAHPVITWWFMSSFMYQPTRLSRKPNRYKTSQ